MSATLLDTAASGYELDVETDADKALLTGHQVFLMLRDTARAEHAPAGSVLSDAVKTARATLSDLAEVAERPLCTFCLSTPHVSEMTCCLRYSCEDCQREHDDTCAGAL